VQIFCDKNHAEHVIEKMLKSNRKWGSRDRSFIAQNTFEIIRNIRLIAACIEITPEELNKESAFQIFGTWQIIKKIELPKWDEFAQLDYAEILSKYEELIKYRRYRFSIPDWMDEMGINEMGTAWEKEIEAMHNPAKLVLRTNILKIKHKALTDLFRNKNIEFELSEAYPDAIILNDRKNLRTTEEYKSGLFEFQDASSQLVSAFLEVSPGMTVIDACAGAGGKSLHLAALMQNKGTIISLDTGSSKLEELKRRATKSGAKIISTKTISNDKIISDLHNTADRLLLDVPCSALGVLSRKPDNKWKLKPEFIESIKLVQKQILEQYSKMLKINGKMVYATCSILPSENKMQIKRFLVSHNNFILEEEKQILPSESGFDGFFMARMQRIK